MNKVLKSAGMVLLGLLVLIVGLPLVLVAAGIVLSAVGFVFGLAVALIKLGVLVAIGYLIYLGWRALRRR